MTIDPRRDKGPADLSGLRPTAVFQAFAEISAIPRGSGEEKAISDHLLAFGRALDLEVIQDPSLNIIIKKPGTPGYESAPTVILQGHMDMVWEKADHSDHAFETDPIRPMVDGDRLRARGTTLGGDNGIAMAYAMALLSSDHIPHPPLEVLMTTQEEVGLKGASQVDPAHLSGKILINLDAEEEGRFFVSCSGGTRCTLKLPLALAPFTGQDPAAMDLEITGLRGGHSGMDIHLGRANANALMARLLTPISGMGISLVSLSGGAMVNAIPRRARARILVPGNQVKALTLRVKEMETLWAREFKDPDPGLCISLLPVSDPIHTGLSPADTERVVEFLGQIPTGVQSMSLDIKGLVESSLNFGVVAMDGHTLACQCSIRSCVDALREEICQRLQALGQGIGAVYEPGAAYPAWEYRRDSKIRPIFEKTFQDLHGKTPEICAIHAGLECGVLGDRLGDMDMISIGPDLHHVHTPDEYLSISSAGRTWEFLCAVLGRLR